MYIFTFYSFLIHTRTRITPMRKTKILLLDAPSKALTQQGQSIDRAVCSCVEIVLVLDLSKELIDSRSRSLTLSLLSVNNVPNWRQISLLGVFMDERTQGGGRGGEQRDSSRIRQTCIHLYDVRVHVQYITSSL